MNITTRIKTEKATSKLIRTRRQSADWLSKLNEMGLTKEFPYVKNPALEPLKQKLLASGGHAVILPAIEEDFDKIMKRGRLSVEKPIMRRSIATRCHSNVADLWESKGGRLKICTGYALSYDGAWRQHTWGLWKGKIVETTEKRIAYFGFRMFQREAELFAWNNL